MSQRRLSKLSEGRNNNLNLIRFIAASLVIVTHSYGVTGNGQDEPFRHLTGLSAGSLAVDIFFVISGFLITKSWYRRQDLLPFLYSRFIRIFPALWVAVFACVFVVGPLYTALSLENYFLHIDTFKFLAENCTLLIKGVATSLPGVFEMHPIAEVNPSLWTLPYELKMYLLLALFSLLGLTVHPAFLPPFVLAAFCGYTIANLELDQDMAQLEATFRFLFFFFSGASFYVYRKIIFLTNKGALLALLLIILAYLAPTQSDFDRLALALGTPYLVMWLGYVPEGFIREFNKLGDYSYGLYIYGFPIQQIVLHNTESNSAVLNLTVSWCMCLVAAALSWHFLEGRLVKQPVPQWVTRLAMLSNALRARKFL